jgi:hypothetical protein
MSSAFDGDEVSGLMIIGFYYNGYNDLERTRAFRAPPRETQAFCFQTFECCPPSCRAVWRLCAGGRSCGALSSRMTKAALRGGAPR